MDIVRRELLLVTIGTKRVKGCMGTVHFLCVSAHSVVERQLKKTLLLVDYLKVLFWIMIFCKKSL